MIKGEARLILMLVVLLFTSGALWFFMKPPYPGLLTQEWKAELDEKYFRGSPACLPSRLSKLGSVKAKDEQYRCDLAATKESERDFNDAERSADAAVASVELSYRQTLMSIAGAIFGIWTVIAAFLAAYYARVASQAARATQNSYIDVERANPIVGLDNFAYKIDQIHFDVVCTNVGGTACVISLYSAMWLDDPEKKSEIYHGHYKVIAVPAGETKIINNVSISRECLRAQNFLDGRISFTSSLDTKQIKDFLFEVFDQPASPYYMTHIDHISIRQHRSSQAL